MWAEKSSDSARNIFVRNVCKKRPPRVARQRGFQRADALCGHDGNALRLAREAEELLVASGSFSPTVAKCWYSSHRNSTCRKCLVWVCLHIRDAIENGPFEVELHHDAQGTGKTGIHSDGKIQGADLAVFDEPGERRQRLAVAVVRVGLGIETLGRRAEGPLHVGIVVEQRKKDRNAFDDGRAKLRLQVLPVVIEPSLDGV